MSVWEDIGRAGLGVSTGGLSELAIRSGMIPDPWGSGPGMINQSLLETPEKSAARQSLARFIQSGTFGGFTAGEKYANPMGFYNPSDIEATGQNKLKGILASGYSPVMNAGAGELMKLLTTDAYNPMNDQGVYAGLTGGIDRNTAEAQAGAKRAGSYAGNLYSTDAFNKQGDIAAQGGIEKSRILATLFQNYGNQKLTGVNQALAFGQGQEAIDMGRVGASQTYGSLERTLKNQEYKDKYSDYLRQREELQMPIKAAQNMLGADENYTIPGVPAPNPWDKILELLVGAGSKFAGASMGAA